MAQRLTATPSTGADDGAPAAAIPRKSDEIARSARRVAPAAQGAPAPTGDASKTERRAAPARPSLDNPHAAPVLTRRPPPVTVRLSQLLWIFSLLAGGITVAYYFVIREEQLPLIIEVIKGVQAGRPDATYTSAADIVFWTVFWVAAGALVVQVALLVSFMNRKPHIRLFQFGTVALVGITYVLALRFVAIGDKGELLGQMFLIQVALALLALLLGSFSGALAWTSRRHDVRRAGGDDGGAEV